MAFIVQNDSGTVAGANSYIEIADFLDYYLDRGIELDLDAEVSEPALIKATAYIDVRFKFVGYKANGRTQTTQWPRLSAYDSESNLVEGIPKEIKDAVCEYAYRALSSDLAPDTQSDDSGLLVSEKTTTVGPITTSIKYAVDATTSANEFKPYQYADELIEGLVLNANVKWISRA